MEVFLGGHGKVTVRVQDDLGDTSVLQYGFETAGVWSYAACLSVGSCRGSGRGLGVGDVICLLSASFSISGSPSHRPSLSGAFLDSCLLPHFGFLQCKGIDVQHGMVSLGLITQDLDFPRLLW